jgi:prepilin-type N-terminal cleavage/methylation domain-containing protein
MRQGGFTVTELMVVVAIVAILLSLGMPSFRYLTNAYRMSAEVNGLLGDLQYARSEAIREGQAVTACVSADGTSCTGGANWASGWIVSPTTAKASRPPPPDFPTPPSRCTTPAPMRPGRAACGSRRSAC